MKRALMLTLCVFAPWLVLILSGKTCEGYASAITLVLSSFYGMRVMFPVALGWIARAVQVYQLQHPFDAPRGGRPPR